MTNMQQISSQDQKHVADLISLFKQHEDENKQQEEQHAREIKKLTDENKVEVFKLQLELVEEKRKLLIFFIQKVQ